MSAQRIRVWFRKGERVRFISHLDVLRFWERALRRAGLPLSYSQGFTPHPKLAFASPLPLGFTGTAEVLDVTLDERVDLDQFRRRLTEETSEDLALVDAREVAVTAPAPQAVSLWADYEVALPGIDPVETRSAVERFMAADSFEWTEERKDKTRTYDLRAGVASLDCQPVEGGVRLSMRLSASQQMTVRPEQVVAALSGDVTPMHITRTGVVLDEPSPAREAWRRKGQYQT